MSTKIENNLHFFYISIIRDYCIKQPFGIWRNSLNLSMLCFKATIHIVPLWFSIAVGFCFHKFMLLVSLS